MIFVMDRNENVLTVLTNNGSPNSCPYYEDSLKESLDTGTSSYEFKVPTNHEASQAIQEGGYVARTDLDGRLVMFTIMELQETHGTAGELLVYAENAGMELLNDIVRPAQLDSVSAEQYLTHVLQDTRWEKGEVEYFGVQNFTLEYKNVMGTLQDGATAFVGELAFRVTMKNGKVHKRYVDMVEKRGNITKKRFAYGKDILSIKRTVDMSNVVTALIGVGEEDLDFKKISYSKANGKPFNKPLDQDWVGDEDALQRYGQQGKHIFGTFSYETKEPETLLTKTWAELQVRKNPSLLYELDVALLERMAGIEPEAVRLGDTLHVVDETFNPPLYLEARVRELDTSFSDPTKDKATLGNYKIVKSNIDAQMRAIQATLLRKEATWDTIKDALNFDEAIVMVNRAKQEAIDTAQEYARTKAEAERVKAEAYADGIVSEEEQARINAVTSAVETARLHAETKADEAEMASKAYSDMKLTEAKNYADQKDATAKTALEAYARTQAEAERIKAEAYADGIISGEEQDRIDAIDQALLQAQAMATKARQDAEQASKAYADLKKTEALAYADQKKAEAITASEAYAKQKAEAERVLAEIYADGIVTAEEEARAEAIRISLAQAQAMADKAKKDAETASKAYSDARLAEAKTYADTKKAEAITASETYANTKAEAERVKAEAYADGVVDAEEEARILAVTNAVETARLNAEKKIKESETATKAYSDARLADAKTYADTKKAEAITASEAYAKQKAEAERAIAEAHADGLVDAEEQARITALTKTLADSKTYADTKAVEAQNASKTYSDLKLVESKTYSDNKLAEAKTYADTKKSEAIKASETYANTKAEAERVIAEAYADGIVDAEEQARITAVTNAVATAKTHAETKATEAQVASKNYSDARLVDAKTYADTKKAESITASQTYTNTKAEAERVKAEVYADGIVTAEEQARITAVNSAVATAKSHAETKAKEAETASKSYADLKLIDAKAYADTKKAEAITASENYAKQKAEAERVLAQIYADGVVDAEEQARISAINKNLADAKSYADLKKQEALTASQQYANQAEANAKNSFKPIMNEHFDHDFSDGKEFWTEVIAGADPTSTTAGTIKASTESTEGVNVWEITGTKHIFSKKPLPINVDRTYQITMKIKQTVNPTTAGKSGVYLGVATLDQNYASITGGAGSHRYFGASNIQITVANGWQIFQGTISGIGDLANQFRPGTVFVRPMFIVNHDGGNGTVQIDYVKFEDVTEGIAIDQRMTDVEQRTTVDSIIATVTESTTFTDVVGSKADQEYVDGTFATTDALTATEQALIDSTDQKINELGVPVLMERVSNVEQTAEQIDFKFTNSGGVNLLRNSVGYAGTDFWLTTAGLMSTLQNDELAQIGSGSGWYSPQGNSAKIEQSVSVVNSNRYTLSFYMNKSRDNGTNGDAGVEVWAGDVKLALVGKTTGQLTDGWEKFTYNINTELSEVNIVVNMGAGSETVITNLMLNIGDVPLQWTLASGEVYNTNVLMDMNGIRIISNQYRGHTVITPQEFSGYAEVIDEETGTREMKRVFTLNKDTTEVSKIQVEEEVRMTPLKIIPVTTGNFSGWAFVPED